MLFGSSGRPVPGELTRGAKVYFVCTNDHPFPNPPYERTAIVEDMHGPWAYLACNRKDRDGKEEVVKRWINFNNVVWFEVRK